jgi:hypothetical protein
MYLKLLKNRCYQQYQPYQKIPKYQKNLKFQLTHLYLKNPMMMNHHSYQRYL